MRVSCLGAASLVSDRYLNEVDSGYLTVDSGHHMAESPDLRFLLLPLPEFALLPFGGFLDKLRFSADDEDYSRQRYCA